MVYSSGLTELAWHNIHKDWQQAHSDVEKALIMWLGAGVL